LYQLEGNPKWPDISSKVNRALLMRQKGRMLPLFLTAEFFFAAGSFGIEGDKDPIAISSAPQAHFSAARLLGTLACALGSIFLFFVSVFLEPPPHEDGRRAVRASLLGPLLCLSHNVVLTQLVYAVFSLVAELSLVSEPVVGLLAFCHSAAAAIFVASATAAIFYVMCLRSDREWQMWVDSFEKAKAGVTEIELILHAGPICLAVFDAFVVKDVRMLRHFQPNFWCLGALALLCTNLYIGFCHVHAFLGGGSAYLYPFMKHIAGYRTWAAFLMISVTVMTFLCALFSAMLWVRSFVG